MARKQKKKIKKKKKKFHRKDKVSAINASIESADEKIEIPTYDFLEDCGFYTSFDLSTCIDSLISCIEDGYFLRWEAVECSERNLPFTREQEEALDELISFSDEDDGPILYINGLARPNEPWYEMLRKVVPKLILDPYETSKILADIYFNGWPRLLVCLDGKAQYLSLPDGVYRPLDVIPDRIRHRLWLQHCFEMLYGIGHDEYWIPENEDEKYRQIEDFISALKEFKEAVKYFDLSIKKMLKLVKLPPKYEKIFIKSLMETLGIKSISNKIYDVL